MAKIIEPAPEIKVKKSVTQQVTDFCVYVGPTIHGVIQSGTIYESDRTAVLKNISEAAKKYPGIERLIIPGKELPEANKALADSNSLLSKTCRSLQKK